MKLTYGAQLPRGGKTNVNIFVFQFVNKHRNGHHIRGRLIHRHAVGLKGVQQVTQRPLQFALRAISSANWRAYADNIHMVVFWIALLSRYQRSVSGTVDLPPRATVLSGVCLD
jgi:hypothetical protein